VGVLKVFAKGKKGFDFHSLKMVLNSMFIPWLRVDDKPMEIAKPLHRSDSILWVH
jgi:hypothetical protein